MPQLISEFIISMDGCARGTKSPGYYGFNGPEFSAWLANKSDQPHQNVLGRKTYEMLNGLPEQARDDDYRKMTCAPGWLYSRTLSKVEWPGLTLVDCDAMEHLAGLKDRSGDELRILGSISLMRQAIKAGLLDRLRLIVCPLIVPKTGIEPLFEGMADMQFKLLDHQLLDGRVMIQDYAPDGAPPTA